MKDFFIFSLILIGLPVIVPLTLVLFWYRCALNAAEKLVDVLDDTTEPVAVVEHLDTLDDIGKKFVKKYPMSTPEDPDCDYIDR